ncbi:hypothetical protein MRB53_005825 [Persea americana]|uniref:Uncharacterized protein n=1 Tax=Persea americana TaxID=3435 RepID=A0ACC2MEF2_PERAE|nr:hypothetical protein MRB53_005825 [Persea americana]
MQAPIDVEQWVASGAEAFTSWSDSETAEPTGTGTVVVEAEPPRGQRDHNKSSILLALPLARKKAKTCNDAVLLWWSRTWRLGYSEAELPMAPCPLALLPLLLLLPRPQLSRMPLLPLLLLLQV